VLSSVPEDTTVSEPVSKGTSVEAISSNNADHQEAPTVGTTDSVSASTETENVITHGVPTHSALTTIEIFPSRSDVASREHGKVHNNSVNANASASTSARLSDASDLAHSNEHSHDTQHSTQRLSYQSVDEEAHSRSGSSTNLFTMQARPARHSLDLASLTKSSQYPVGKAPFQCSTSCFIFLCFFALFRFGLSTLNYFQETLFFAYPHLPFILFVFSRFPLLPPAHTHTHKHTLFTLMFRLSWK
jgi:hypothetical protein